MEASKDIPFIGGKQILPSPKEVGQFYYLDSFGWHFTSMKENRILCNTLSPQDWDRCIEEWSSVKEKANKNLTLITAIDIEIDSPSRAEKLFSLIT